jgi:4-amino-4-deoxy-L-arabinose transferase-like glycosyltransferase
LEILKSKYFSASIPIIYFIVTYSFFYFNGLYGQDAHEYLRYSRALLEQFAHSLSPGDYNWPIVYPLLGAFIAFILHTDTLLIMQLISVFSFSISTLLLFHWMNRLYDNKKYLGAFLTINLLLAPMLIRNSQVVMSESICLLFIVLCFYAHHQLQSKNSFFWIILLFIAGILAFSTRYAASVLVIIPIASTAFGFVRKKQNFKLFISASVALLFLLPHFIYKGYSSNFLSHNWLLDWDINNFFSHTFSTAEGSMNYNFINIVFAFATNFHPIFSIFLLPLLFFIKKIDFYATKEKQIIFWSIVIYTLFLAGIPYQNKRFFSLSFPLLLLIMFPLFERALEKLKSQKKLAFIAIVTLQLCIGFYYMQEFIQLNKLEKQLTTILNNNKVVNVYSFDADVAIRSYNNKIVTLNLWEKLYDEFQTGYFVLFNEAKFSKQWKNKNPMLNWHKIKSDYKLIEIETAPNDWKLYKIVGKKNVLFKKY